MVIWQNLGTNILKRQRMGTSKKWRRGEGILRDIKVFSTQKAMKKLWWVLSLAIPYFSIHFYNYTLFEITWTGSCIDIICSFVFRLILQNGNRVMANLDFGIHGDNILPWVHYSGNLLTELMPWIQTSTQICRYYFCYKFDNNNFYLK